MPPFKKRRTKRKRSEKKRSYGPQKSIMLRGHLAPRTTVKLRYSETISMGPTTAGTSVNALYLANGMFDPTIAIGGHQPMGYDNIMALYDHFTVTGSKITATITPDNTTYVPFQLSIYLAPGSSVISPAAPARLRETDRVNWVISNPSTSWKGVSAVSNYFSASKFFGVKDAVGESSYKGSATSDPTETAVFQILYGALDEASSAPAATVAVDIEYTAVFTEPKAFAQS